MKNIFPSILLIPAILLGSALATSAATPPDKKAKVFVSKLPPKVFLTVKNKESATMLVTAIQKLGPTPNVEFFALPKEAVPPIATKQGPPRYPVQLSRSATNGAAQIIGLISPSGDVVAVYCSAATQPEFADSAATAVARWKFKPAKLGGTAVPVIFVQRIEFNSETR